MLTQSHLPITERSYPEISGTVIAFDFGEKRIGVAVGETMLKVAHPLSIINLETNATRFSAIEELTKEWKPSLIIVGLPSYLDGTEHRLTQLAKKFAQRLEGRFNLPILMRDERLTSVEATQQLSNAGVNSHDQKSIIDAVAAQVILQSYFDSLPNLENVKK